MIDGTGHRGWLSTLSFRHVAEELNQLIEAINLRDFFFVDLGNGEVLKYTEIVPVFRVLQVLVLQSASWFQRRSSKYSGFQRNLYLGNSQV